MKRVLTIAGSDCSGGAGIQADLKTMSAHGVFGMSVIVSVVAENTSRVLDIQDVMPDMIEKQIDAIYEDIGTDAVKIGMLSTPQCMEAVAKKLEEYAPSNVVVDPVMYAKNGCPLMQPSSVAAFIDLILPKAFLLTPNLPEAERICGITIQTPDEMWEAARRIHQMGCPNVLIKGGHLDGDALDILYDGTDLHSYTSKRIPTKHTHGTGCTLSSAIASDLALGFPIHQAVERAKEYVFTAIEHAPGLGKGNGPLHHFYQLYHK